MITEGTTFTLCVCGRVSTPMQCPQSQDKVLDPGLQLQAVMSCLTEVLGVELGSPATGMLIPNHWAFFPAPSIVQDERLIIVQATSVT